MLGWAVTFLIIAIIAAVFGFGGIAAASAGIAKGWFPLPSDTPSFFPLRMERRRSSLIDG
jgi:Protein of unknown function (DUF1328)